MHPTLDTPCGRQLTLTDPGGRSTPISSQIGGMMISEPRVEQNGCGGSGGGGGGGVRVGTTYWAAV